MLSTSRRAFIAPIAHAPSAAFIACALSITLLNPACAQDSAPNGTAAQSTQDDGSRDAKHAAKHEAKQDADQARDSRDSSQSAGNQANSATAPASDTQSATQDDKKHDKKHDKDKSSDAPAVDPAAPTNNGAGTGAGNGADNNNTTNASAVKPTIAWYVSLHADGAADPATGGASTGPSTGAGADNILGFASDGTAKGSVLGAAPASIGQVHGLRGVLPLSDGTILVIAAWKENTQVLQYGKPVANGTRPFMSVFTSHSATNPLLLHPYCLAQASDGTIYASNQDSNTVSRYGAPGSANAGVPLGLDGSVQSGATAGMIIPSQTMQSDGIKMVRGIAFGPDGKLYISDRGQGEVSRWDPATGKREATVLSKKHDLKTPIQLLFSSDGSVLFVSDNKRNSVFRVTLATGAVDDFVPVAAGLDAPSALALDGDWLYVGSRKGQAVLRFNRESGVADSAPFLANLPDNPEFFVLNRF